MKKTVLLGMLIAVSGLFLKTSAQNCLSGEDSVKCLQQISIFDTYYRNGESQYRSGDKEASYKTFKDAEKAFFWAFENCPGCKKAVLVNGPILLQRLIQFEEDEARKEGLIDTLLMAYDMRAQYWGDEGKCLMYKGMYSSKYRTKEFKSSYKTLKKAMELQGDQMMAGALQYYTRNLLLMVKYDDEFSCQDMVQEYVKMDEIIQANRGDKSYEAAEKSILKMVGSCLTCDVLVDLYSSNFEANKDNMAWLQKAKALMERKDCMDDDNDSLKAKASATYQNIVEAMHALSPSFASAIAIGQVYVGKDAAKAQQFIDQAIELAETDDEKVQVHNTLAAMYFDQKKYSMVRTEARKAIAIKANYKSYSWIAEAYGASQPFCLDNDDLGGIGVYWVAVDYLYKAKSLAEGEDEKKHIQKRINQISGFFPEKTNSKIFMSGLKEGDSYTVGCWINESTKVRLK